MAYHANIIRIARRLGMDSTAKPRRITGRVLGMDVGSHVIGYAVSDAQNLRAHPVDTIPFKEVKYRGDAGGGPRGRQQLRFEPIPQRVRIEQTCEKLRELVFLHDVKALVIGLPHDDLSRPTDMSRQIEEFALDLKQALSPHMRLPFVLWDERRSSAQAVLHLEQQLGRKPSAFSKLNIDAMAAAVILQRFLDYANHHAPLARLTGYKADADSQRRTHQPVATRRGSSYNPTPKHPASGLVSSLKSE